MEVVQLKARIFGDGDLRIGIDTNFANREVEVIVIIQPIRELDPRCTNMLIEDLNVSEECLDSLRKSGFTVVGEPTAFLEQTWGGRGGTVGVSQAFLKYLDETVNKLKEIGCWPESLAGE